MDRHLTSLRMIFDIDNLDADNKRGNALAWYDLHWTPYTGPELFTVMCKMSAAGLEIGYLSGASWCKPSFYQSGVLVAPDDKRALFVYADNEMVRLSGNSDDIRRANALAGLDVNADNAIDYITFFAENIQAQREGFRVVHEGDELNFPDGAAVDIEYPTRIEALSLTRHFMKAMVVYSGALFRTIMFCDDSGVVNMIDDEPLGVVHYQPRRGPSP